jgi:DNA uptake protein ComE-like DNA-binding protein
MKTKLLAAIAAFALAAGSALAQGTASPQGGGAAPAKGSTAKPADQKAAQKGAASAEKLDINTASAEELAELKGIGPVRAQAIVKGRPYSGKDDLVNRKIVPQSVYDDIKDQIIAHQKK